MNIIRQILKLLNRPFPQQDNPMYFLRTIGLVSLFVAFFLYAFRPFDLDDAPINLFWTCIGFGLVSFVAMALYGFTISRQIKLRLAPGKWVFGVWILDTMAMMTMISLGNFLFARLSFFGSIRWEFFPQMISSTFLIGIFPVSMIGALTLFRAERKYQDIAREINEKPVSKSGNDMKAELQVMGVKVEQIRYIEALQNYVRIAYVNESGAFKSITERATLKSILDASSGSSLVRCHRSYVVNRSYILETSGNAQGLMLQLSDSDKEVPVSRTYVPMFRGEKLIA